MKVQLINCTGWGTIDPARMAAELLVFTKQTRLNMDADQMVNVQMMSDEDIKKELEYMANTIPSSWEFVDYTFLINGVTRAFTHQFVRTRTGSYAQQTMRVLDVHGWDYHTGPTLQLGEEPSEAEKDRADLYHKGMRTVGAVYDEAIALGAAIEDARGILPTNIHTNIVAKFNLRTMAEMAWKRASSRTQGEYRDVMDAMKAAVIEVHPWADMFFNRTFDRAACDAESSIITLWEQGRLSDVEKTDMIKLIDQMRAK